MKLKIIVAAALVSISMQAQTPLPPKVSPGKAESARQLQEVQPRTSQPGPLIRRGGLTEEQREKLRSINEKAREEQQETRKQLQAARSELERLIRAGEVDEGAIRKQAEAIGKLEGDLVVLRAKQSAQYREAGIPQMNVGTPAVPGQPGEVRPRPGTDTPNPRIQQRLQEVVRRRAPADAPERKTE